MKVVIAANSVWSVINFRSELILALEAAGHDVVVVAPGDSEDDAFGDLGLRFVQLPFDSRTSSPLHDIGLLVRYVRLFRRERPNLLLGFTIKPNIYGTLAAGILGIPVINNVTGLGIAFNKNNWLNRLVRGLYWLAFCFSSHAFFQNQNDRDFFLDHNLVKAERASLLPGSGVNLSVFQPWPKPIGNGDEPCFLMISRLLWEKGVVEFAEAAKLVKLQIPKARFVLLGPVESASQHAVTGNQVEQWVSAGILDYPGQCEDVRPFIADCDVVVLPSYYREGTPRALLEGAAMAKPLITTNTPGCRDVVDDGTNGFLCRARDAPDLARKMLALATLSPDEIANMGSASRRKVESSFSVDAVVDSYLDEIGKLSS